MPQVFFIPRILPGLNEYLAFRGRHGSVGKKKGSRGVRWCKANQEKQKLHGVVAYWVKQANITPMSKAYISFEWIEPTRRRDPDNIIAGGRKIILDALQEVGVLHGDGWKYILGFSDRWSCNKYQSGVRVTLLSEEEMRNGSQEIER